MLQRPRHHNHFCGSVFIGNPIHKDWETPIVGRALLTCGKLTMETDSIQQTNLLRRLVEAGCQPLLGSRARSRCRVQRMESLRERS